MSEENVKIDILDTGTDKIVLINGHEDGIKPKITKFKDGTYLLRYRNFSGTMISYHPVSKSLVNKVITDGQQPT